MAALLTAIGPEARKVFKTWNLTATQKKGVKGIIELFDNDCNPRKSIPFERYRFNSRQQEPGESFDRFVTVLHQIADKCAFDAITPDGILGDRIIFGSADNKVRERLLREPELDLAKTLDICRASEMSQAQIKAVGELNSSNVHLLKESMKSLVAFRLINRRLLEINFVILADSVVESTRVNARPVLRGERSASRPARRTICEEMPRFWQLQ